MASEKRPAAAAVDHALAALATALEQGFAQAQAQQHQAATEGHVTTARGVVTMLAVLVDPQPSEED